MKFSLKPWQSVGLIAVSTTLISGCDDEADVTLRVMETTDIHAYVMNFDYYKGKQNDTVGLVKTASLIEQARAEVKNSVLVDNGDLIQGSPLGDYYAKIRGLKDNEIHPIYKAMNQLQYDVANVGNHEFNFGLPFLHESIDDAQFPYISANVFIDDGDQDDSNDQPYFAPYLIQQKQVIDEDGDVHELNIGYIGFVPPQIMQWDQPNLEHKVKAKDIVDMAEFYVPKMKAEGADIVIAIPHSGLVTSERKGGDEHSSYYLSQVEGIDAILFGHAHKTFPGDPLYNDLPGVDNVNGTINGVPAVMPGYWGRYLGFIDLNLHKDADGEWSVKEAETVLRPIYKKNEDKTITSLAETHKGIAEAVQHDHEEVNNWIKEPFAKISAPINSYFALVMDDPSIQVVSDAQIWYVENLVKGTELEGLPLLSVGSPFRAGASGPEDYTVLQTGDVSYANVADLFIYSNTVQVLKLSGREVKEWLEMSAGQFNQVQPGSKDAVIINPDFPSYLYDVLDGVSYQIDVTQPARYDAKGNLINGHSERIVNLKYQGNALDVNQSYLVITNNYRAGGGGNFPGAIKENIVIDAPNENRQVVADYLIAKTQENEAGLNPSADSNWSFAPIADTTVVFRSSGESSAQDFAKSADNLTFIGLDNDGYGQYRMDLAK